MHKTIEKDKNEQENLFLDNDNNQVFKSKKSREILTSKEKQFGDNLILSNDSGFLKTRSINKVLEEENPGHIPKFHQQERDEGRNIDREGLRKEFNVTKPQKNKSIFYN